jgi:uncharacterized protein
MSNLEVTSKQIRIQAEGLALEAVLSQGRGSAGAVVAPPHPLYGGSLTNPVVQITVEALLEIGCSTVAFNYRGTEGSQGVATASLDAATADYAAALQEVRSHAKGSTIAAGYSFGAGAALLSVRDDLNVAGLVLVAPPLGMLHLDDLTAFAGRVLVVVGDDDEYAPLTELRELLAHAPKATLEVLPGVDHFFHFGGLSALFGLVRDHVQTWLKA